MLVLSSESLEHGRKQLRIDEQGEGDGRHQDLVDDELLPVKHVSLLKVHVGVKATSITR